MQAKNILSVLLLLSFTSCDFFTTELEEIDYPIDQRIVLNAVIHAECDSNFVFLNDSYAFFDHNTSLQYEWKTNANGEGKWVVQNVSYLDNIQSILSKNGAPNSDMHFRRKDKALYFKENFDAGDKVEIEVTDKGRKVSASAIIPEKPIILQVDTSSLYVQEDNSYSEGTSLIPYIRLLIKIKAQPDIKNYYRISVTNSVTPYYDYDYKEDDDEIHFITTGTYSTYFKSKDPILNNGQNTNEILEELGITKPEMNVFNIFTDDLFQNGEYTLDLYVPDFSRNIIGNSNNYSLYHPMTPKEKEHLISEIYSLHINLQAISEDLYAYYYSLQKYQQVSQSLIEPIRVYNNIEGGLGIFGAVNELKYGVMERELLNK